MPLLRPTLPDTSEIEMRRRRHPQSGMRFPSALGPDRFAAMATADSLYTEILRHLLTIVGFLLAVFLIARLMSEKRQPGNTVAWMLRASARRWHGAPALSSTNTAFRWWW